MSEDECKNPKLNIYPLSRRGKKGGKVKKKQKVSKKSWYTRGGGGLIYSNIWMLPEVRGTIDCVSWLLRNPKRVLGNKGKKDCSGGGENKGAANSRGGAEP